MKDPAFPIIAGPDDTYADLGLSKREYVAAGVLVGLMSHAVLPFCTGADEDPAHLAGLACRYADALLIELAK